MIDTSSPSGSSPDTTQKRTPPVQHLAIIMDGNGRWAKERGLSRSAGHKAGTDTAKKIVEECVKLGVPYLTLYTFSKENWKRPQEEVSFLFGLLVDFLKRELSSLVKQGVKVQVLGELGELPFTVRSALQHTISKTKQGTALTLNLALNYSSRDEILRACRLCLEGGLTTESLTAKEFSSYLYTAGQPDPDLVIRTSGEQRISNFLLYQTAYSEFYFTPVYWPDFTAEHLLAAFDAYLSRNRRFGGI